jgi:hypothetical protein
MLQQEEEGGEGKGAREQGGRKGDGEEGERERRGEQGKQYSPLFPFQAFEPSLFPAGVRESVSD